jgi:hypothetical protein
MTQVEKGLAFDRHSAPAAPSARTIKAAVLLVALLLYAAGFVILYRAVAASMAEGGAPALTQYVGP